MSRKFWIFFIVLMILGVVTYTAACIAESTRPDQYLNVTEDGIISVKPEYVDISRLNETRYSDEERRIINTYAGQTGLSAKDIAVMHYLTDNSVKNTYGSLEDVQNAIGELEETYGKNISDICSEKLAENDYMHMIIECKLSSAKKHRTIRNVKIPKKLGKTTVTGIAKYGMAGVAWAENVYLPDTVNAVNDSAFFASAVKNVYIRSENADISKYAFEGMPELAGVFDSAGKDITSDVLPASE